jgi:hypothetical protein
LIKRKREKREGYHVQSSVLLPNFNNKKVKLDPPVSVKNNTDIFLIKGILILLVIAKDFYIA